MHSTIATISRVCCARDQIELARSFPKTQDLQRAKKAEPADADTAIAAPERCVIDLWTSCQRAFVRASPLQANSDPSRRRYRVARQRIRGVPIQLPRRTQDCFQRLVDYQLIQTSLDRRRMPPGHSADAMGSRGHRAALSPRDSREMHPRYPKARPYLITERSS